MQKTVALGIAFLLTLSCQSFQYGPARVGAIHPPLSAFHLRSSSYGGQAGGLRRTGELPLRANPADQEFETPDEPEKDKIGMWIFVGVAAAAGVGAAVIVPMAIGGKL